MNAAEKAVPGNPAEHLLTIYDRALPQVYGYVVRRCGIEALAEDLTAEVFMAAATALVNGAAEDIGIGWLIGTARHKLVDHWRRNERQRTALSLVATDGHEPDPNDEPISTTHTHEVLDRISAEHRSALTLRYIDGLPVGEVASILGRSVHATESLLQRAKASFRQISADAISAEEGGQP
ncbi:MAG: putative polymerase sigma factor [Acidimicrobiales bacterium]|nr:putative polymerase sigma factor [Acidimicrobiales bacterium]